MASDPSRDPASFPGFTGEEHPDVFTTPPPQPTEKKPGQLSSEQVKEYFENGFVVVENLFTYDEIEPVRECLRKLVDNLAHRLLETGRVKDLYEDHGLKDRLLMLEREWPGAVTLIVKYGKLTPEFQALYENEKLLNIMEQLIGPDIGAGAVWNNRPKAPDHPETNVPWHQDSGYYDKQSYSTLVVTAWIAFLDVTEQNGCLEFVKGGHKKGLVVPHHGCYTYYLSIDESEFVNRLGADPKTDFIKCPVKAGGVVLFNNMIPHRSVPNVTNEIRWGMDLRYQDPSKPWGYFNIKKGITLRKRDDPNFKPDWESYKNQSRFDAYETIVQQKRGEEEHDGDEFNTLVTGPHMDMWKISKTTPHTDYYFTEKEKKEKHLS